MIKIQNLKNEMFRIYKFEISNLFRISIFEFRILNPLPLKLTLILSSLLPTMAFAATECVSGSGGYCVNLAGVAYAQGVPGLEFLKATNDFGELISNIYVFGMGLVAISALVVLVAAGVWYMSAGDNAGRAGEAKKWMGNAIFGLVLALLSWLILYTINPDFIKKPDWVQNLEQISDVPGVENLKFKTLTKEEVANIPTNTKCGGIFGTCSSLPEEEKQSMIKDPNVTKVIQPTDKSGNSIDIASQTPTEKQQSTTAASANCVTGESIIYKSENKVWNCVKPLNPIVCPAGAPSVWCKNAFECVKCK